MFESVSKENANADWMTSCASSKSVSEKLKRKSVARKRKTDTWKREETERTEIETFMDEAMIPVGDVRMMSHPSVAAGIEMIVHQANTFLHLVEKQRGTA